MATILDDEETVEAQALYTSFDPYGQLIKMLMPRALCIAIYDRNGTALWLSDSCDGPDLLQLVEEALDAARSGRAPADERDGCARSWNGDTAYVFMLRDGEELLGGLALACQDGASGSRPFAFAQGLLRPALQVLARELANQYSLEDLRRDLTARDADLALLLEAEGPEEAADRELDRLLASSVRRLDCALGALYVPDRHIELSHWVDPAARRDEAAAVEQVGRRLYAWIQVQRRTLMLNKAPTSNSPNNPVGSLPYKMLACPVRHGVGQVEGVLLLFRRSNAADFETRHVRLVEILARRIGATLQTSYDAATGLLSRSAFEQRALAALATARTASHSIAYGDLDRLHGLNENYGMHVGDRAIAHIAELIRLHLPPGAFAARLSAGRFILFFERTATDVAQSALNELQAAIAGTAFSHAGAQLDLSITFGLAAVAHSSLPLSHALAKAEAACKAAKRGSPSMAVEARGCESSQAPTIISVEVDGDMLRALREAIANDRFRMEAQPVVRLGDVGPARRFELLLRMLDPAGATVAPEKFLAAAERACVASSVDRWVVQYALEILSSAAAALENLGAHFSVNIGAQSLADDDFPDFLAMKLREYALPPALLSFEIAESAAVANVVRTEVLIRRLQELGHAIALDDFGRGLSSLTYLKALRAAHLKIDGALVRDLVGARRSQGALSAIVELAHTMSLQTTAKCVESDGLLEAVKQLGVDFAQGFAIGRPRALEQVLQELLKGAPGVLRNSGSRLMARLTG